MEIKEKVEEIWFIYGLWFGNRFFGIKKYAGKGKEASVEFDWKKGVNFFVLGWKHTHPGSYGCSPSSTDHSTMRGWVKAKNSKLICAITCLKTTKYYCYFRKNKNSPIEFNEIFPFKLLNIITGFFHG
jgi:proteasome lid subunit RPN8/RPN11